MLQEHLSTEYEITSILESIVPLANVVRTWRSLVMTLPSEIIILQWEGQEATWIEITITELNRTSTALPRGHITLWINRKMRSVKLWLDWALLGGVASPTFVLLKPHDFKGKTS